MPAMLKEEMIQVYRCSGSLEFAFVVSQVHRSWREGLATAKEVSPRRSRHLIYFIHQSLYMAKLHMRYAGVKIRRILTRKASRS